MKTAGRALDPLAAGKWLGERIAWHSGVLLTRMGLSSNCDRTELERFKNRHSGDIGFLIGNGRSVRTTDLEKLIGRTTFCFNRFHLAYPKTTFRPTYTLSADFGMIRDFGSQIVAESEGTVFLAYRIRPCVSGRFIWIGTRYQAPSLVFSKKIYHHVVVGGSSLVVAIQLGYFMGIRRFVLYGVDHDFQFQTVRKPAKNEYRTAIGDGNHFIDNYRSGKSWCPPNMALIEKSLLQADHFLRRRGGWIINATRNGKLDVLERMDFDQAFFLES